jgi:hypothetical protein
MKSPQLNGLPVLQPTEPDSAGTGRFARWSWLLAVIVALVLPRIVLLVRSRVALIDSDEAITGLMARHILGGEFPIWLYGINYQGSLEAYVAAALFAVLGSSPLVLKLEPFCWFVGFACSHYLLAREVTTRLAARLSVLLVSLSPAFLMVWSLGVIGTYMSMLCLGTLALLLAARALARGFTTRRLIALGFVAGLAWWTFPLAIAFIAPILLLLFFYAGPYRVRVLGTVLLAFVVGSAAFWPYNLTHKMSSLRVRSQIAHEEATMASSASGLIRRAIPILMGARAAHANRDFVPMASLLTLTIFVVCASLSARRFFIARSSATSGPPGMLVLATFSWILVLFVISGFGYNADEPRYLIPVYAVLYIVLLHGLAPTLQYALALLLLAGNVVGSYNETTTLSTPLNHEPTASLFAYLRQHGVRNAYAPYWTAYRLTFESNEEIIFSPPPNDLVRYTPHLTAVQNDPSHAYVQLNEESYKDLQYPLRVPAGYAQARVGNFEVFLPRLASRTE